MGAWKVWKETGAGQNKKGEKDGKMVGWKD